MIAVGVKKKGSFKGRNFPGKVKYEGRWRRVTMRRKKKERQLRVEWSGRGTPTPEASGKIKPTCPLRLVKQVQRSTQNLNFFFFRTLHTVWKEVMLSDKTRSHHQKFSGQHRVGK